MTTTKACSTAAADIQEVILQAAIYCGVPAANRAISVAGDILREKASWQPGPEGPPHAGHTK